MPQEDYLLKYLEKLNRVIAAMLGFRQKGYPEDALRIANETYKELLNTDIQNFADLSKSELEQIIESAKINPTIVEYLAKISTEVALTYKQKEEKDKVLDFNEKALLLYEFLNEKDKVFSFERELIIAELKESLK